MAIYVFFASSGWRRYMVRLKVSGTVKAIKMSGKWDYGCGFMQLGFKWHELNNV